MAFRLKTIQWIAMLSAVTNVVGGQLFRTGNRANGGDTDCVTPSRSPIRRSNDDPPYSAALRAMITSPPSKCITAAPSQGGNIGGFVWKDSNADGLSDESEPRFQGVTVKLVRSKSEEIIDTIATDENGIYEFNGIIPGEYFIEFVNPIGYIFSPQNVNGDERDSDPDIAGKTSTFVLSPGGNLESDAGVVLLTDAPTKLPTGAPTKLPTAAPTKLPTIAPTKSPTTAPTKLPTTAPTKLPTTAPTKLPTVITTKSPTRDPTKLPTVIPTKSPTVAPTKAPIITNAPTKLPTTAPTKMPTLLPTNSPTSAPTKSPTAAPTEPSTAAPTKAPMIESSIVTGFVWNDLNEDGIQNTPSEPGIAGVTVKLLDCSGNVVQSTKSSSEGIYVFEGAKPGCAVIEFEVPEDFIISAPRQGGNPDNDSDPDPETSQTPMVTLEAGGEIELDAGLSAASTRAFTAGLTKKPTLPPTESPIAAPTPSPTFAPTSSASAASSKILAVIIDGFVWEDTNANGIQDTDEPGSVGVSVELFDASDNLIDDTTTQSDGFYQFNTNAPGSYVIKVGLPDGFGFSPKSEGSDDEIDSDVDENGSTITFALAPASWDAGLISMECTCQNRESEIRDVLSEVSDLEKLDDINMPQGKAFDWIVNIDPLKLCPKCVMGCQFVQRYTMALFYFSTKGDQWLNCAAGGPCESVDMKMPCNSGTPSNWLSGDNECDWCGNMCNEDMCLTEIQIETNNQAGFIPDEISELTNLVDLRLEKGYIGGTIPTTIGKLTKLNFLDLDFQRLTGTLPDGLWSLTELTTIDVNDCKLSGTISDGIGNLINLYFLQAQNNNFSGTLPDVFSPLTKIGKVQFEGNTFTGEMPQSMCDHRCGAGDKLFSCLERLRADCGGENPAMLCSAPDCCDACKASPGVIG